MDRDSRDDQDLIELTPYVCECGERFASWTLYLEHEATCD